MLAYGLSVAVAGDFVWVTNTDDQTLTRVDPKTGHTDTIGGLKLPIDVVAEGSRYIWVSTATYNQVVRIDARTLRPDLSVSVGRTAFLLAIGAGSLWVTELPTNFAERGNVGEIDLKTARVERTIRVQTFPVDVTLGEGAAWVTNGADASISRIDLGDGAVERVPIGFAPGNLVVAFGSVWVTEGATYETIRRVNPATRQADAVIKVGKSRAFDVAADAHNLWAVVREQGEVVRIDPRTDRVAEMIELGYKPQGLAVGAGALWVTVGHGRPGPAFLSPH